jgi:hypothetical protein
MPADAFWAKLAIQLLTAFSDSHQQLLTIQLSLIQLSLIQLSLIQLSLIQLSLI